MPVNIKIASNRKAWIKKAIKTVRAFTMQDTVQNLNIMLKERFQIIERQMFKTQGGFGGHGTWRPLSEPYATWKAKKYPGKTILRRTDRLYNSLTSSTGESIVIGGKSPEGYRFRFGTQVPYAAKHQTGSESGDETESGSLSTFPQRRFFDITEQQGRGISAAIARTVVDGLFTRGWFDRVEKTRVFKNTGFDIIDNP